MLLSFNFQRIRNNLPMDVRDLMEKAAERNVKEQESRRALQSAKDVSVMKSIVALDNVVGGRLSHDQALYDDKRQNGHQLPEQAGRGSIGNGVL